MLSHARPWSWALFTILLHAQLSVAQLAFTFVPALAIIGQPVDLKWSLNGLPDSPVSLYLYQGANHARFLSKLTSSGTGGTYTWTPTSVLNDGADYSLQLVYGNNEKSAYSGEFSVYTIPQNAAPTVYTSTTINFADPTNTVPDYVPAQPTGAATTVTSAAGSSSAVLTVVVSSAATTSVNGAGVTTTVNNVVTTTVSSALSSSSSGGSSSSTGSGASSSPSSATTTAANAATAPSPLGTSNTLALGLGLGLGIPLVLLAIALVSFLCCGTIFCCFGKGTRERRRSRGPGVQNPYQIGATGAAMGATGAGPRRNNRVELAGESGAELDEERGAGAGRDAGAGGMFGRFGRRGARGPGGQEKISELPNEAPLSRSELDGSPSVGPQTRNMRFERGHEIAPGVGGNDDWVAKKQQMV